MGRSVTLVLLDADGRRLGELPARLARIERCGLPDTLVHGDLHPGNTRIGGGRRRARHARRRGRRTRLVLRRGIAPAHLRA